LAERLSQTFAERSVDVLWIAGKLQSGDTEALAAALNRIAVRGTVSSRHDP
jgi:hypothetical protein